MVLATMAGIPVLFGALPPATRYGKRQEATGGVLRSHVVSALALSVALPLLELLHQWSVGNLAA